MKFASDQERRDFMRMIEEDGQSREDLQAENARLRVALAPFARLQVPMRPVGNAGAYSIRFRDIEAAKSALEPPPSQVDGTDN